ncbi:hypothetical protein [Sphingosinicella sp.]|uniref:hypothetical protein n=1 Tax=Sphingosinicella sp. TaxID=1917971 RepID=UPI0035B3E26B
MNEIVSVFGFGSFFCGKKNANDIDLLLLHESTRPASCQFAIDCKSHFLRYLPRADVVMLSNAEASRNGFIMRSAAIALGTIHFDNCEMQVRDMVQTILSRSPY